MRRATQFAIILLLPSLMAACGPGNKQGTGTIVGATAGAVAGAAIGGPSNRVGGAAIGAVAGGILGNVIGRDMDERGVVMMAHGRDTAVEEASAAYKDVEDVVNVVHTAGLAKKVCRLRPVGVVKG